MDLALKIGAFIISLIVVGLGFLKVFDRKLESLNKEIKDNEVEIASLRTKVEMLERNMWDQTKLKALIIETSTETVKLAVAEFKIELLKLGVGVDKRESGIRD